MQRDSSNTTGPRSVLNIAVVGHADAQAGCSQCMQSWRPNTQSGWAPVTTLVEGNQRVIVGVEIARVLIAFAGEEICMVRRPVVPRFARHHAGPAANTPGIVLDHRFRFHCRCAHLRVLFRVTANFLGLNSPRSARRTRSSEKRFINFFSSLRDLRVLRGESSVPILSGSLR